MQTTDNISIIQVEGKENSKCL